MKLIFNHSKINSIMNTKKLSKLIQEEVLESITLGLFKKQIQNIQRIPLNGKNLT